MKLFSDIYSQYIFMWFSFKITFHEFFLQFSLIFFSQHAAQNIFLKLCTHNVVSHNLHSKYFHIISTQNIFLYFPLKRLSMIFLKYFVMICIQNFFFNDFTLIIFLSYLSKLFSFYFHSKYFIFQFNLITILTQFFSQLINLKYFFNVLNAIYFHKIFHQNSFQ